MTARAQSETLGFVLVFSVILLAVGTVYVGGFSAIDESRQDAQIQNMERAFDVLADNFRDLHREGASRRATEIKLGDDTLTYRNVTSIQFSAVDPTNASHNASFPASAEPIDAIVYRTGPTEVVYSGGGVIRTDDDHAAMLSPPRWVVSDDRTLVPLVLTHASTESRALHGPTTLLLRSRVQSRGVSTFVPENPDTDPARVNVTVSSPYAGAWVDFFEAEAFTHVSGDAADGTVTYQFNTSRLVVVRTELEVTMRP